MEGAEGEAGPEVVGRQARRLPQRVVVPRPQHGALQPQRSAHAHALRAVEAWRGVVRREGGAFPWLQRLAPPSRRASLRSTPTWPASAVASSTSDGGTARLVGLGVLGGCGTKKMGSAA